MTFQEANKNTKSLFCRNELSYEETVKRLSTYFLPNEINDIINSAEAVTSWTDGVIVVLCIDKENRKFSIVASGIYMELIEP